jgi:hypothetical protein
MDKTPQYQRAVTPTIDNSVGSGFSRGGAGKIEGKVLNYNVGNNKGKRISNPLVSDKAPMPSGAGASMNATKTGSSSPRNSFALGGAGHSDINVLGRGSSTASRFGSNLSASRFSSDYGTVASDHGGILSSLPRQDLVPLSDELPTDGIIFARLRSNNEFLVVFRTPEERARNPERLNLDRYTL